jgi:hypothetical protein
MMDILPAVDPVFAYAAAAGIGAVFLIGAIEKLREPGLFRDAVEDYQLLPAGAVPLVARTLPLLEGMAGALLLPTVTRALGALLALALLLVVTAAIAINLLRGRDRIDCGCGGNLHTPLGMGLVLRNSVLMLLVLAAAAPPTARAAVWLDFVAVGFATLFLLGLYFLANAMLSHHSHLLDLRNSP